jgi:AcrR family transcriptional regulator
LAGRKKKAVRRKPGRPQASQKTPGRDGIVAAAARLFATLPPHRVTNVMVAREAGVDPALVRYYFASRAELIVSVVEHIVTSWVASHQPPANASPADRLAAVIRGMVDFARSVRSMQRLMIEECAESKQPGVRRRVRELNAKALENYARIFAQDQPGALVPSDPLLVYVAIIGMSEFFEAAQAMILPLLADREDPAALEERYKDFIVGMVLDGLRPRGR